jgi:transposase
MSRTGLWVGLDVGADSTMICATDDQGKVLFDRLLPTNASALHAILKPQKRRIRLIGLEAGSFGIQLTRSLRRLGYRVAMFDSRQASKFLAIRQNKTDKNDARGLADIARLGRQAVSEVRVKSPECQRLKSTLVTRQRLVRLRLATESSIRSLFRLNGGQLKSSKSSVTFRKNALDELRRIRKVEKIDLAEDVEPLLALSEAMRANLSLLDRKLSRRAADDPICRRFLEIPGVGPISALSFFATVEDPTRFRRNADVGAYLGMTPKIRQSGQTSVRLRISKAGDAMTRRYLTTAAGHHLRLAESTLSAWGASLAKRAGKRRAQTAVARKLAVMMIAMWKANESYDARRGQEPDSSRD